MTRTIWRPGLILLAVAVQHYADRPLDALTGWGDGECYAVAQAAGQAMAWAIIGSWPRLPWPAVMACALGAWGSLARVSCLVGQILAPVVIPAGATICGARMGIDFEAWDLEALAACALAFAGWASAQR